MTHLEITYRDFKNFYEFLFLQDLATAPFKDIEQFSDVYNALNLSSIYFLMFSISMRAWNQNGLKLN